MSETKMGSLDDCRIEFERAVVLSELVHSTETGPEGVVDPISNGSLKEALQIYRDLPLQRRQRMQLRIDHGTIEGSPKTLLDFDDIEIIASRPDSVD